MHYPKLKSSQTRVNWLHGPKEAASQNGRGESGKAAWSTWQAQEQQPQVVSGAGR